MPPRTKLNTESRQAELVRAALALAAQRSPAELTTGDLAQAIGITQGGVFRHFKSKEAIWLAALDWAHQTLLDTLQQAARLTTGDALQALRSVFIAHIEFVTQHPGVPRLIFQELQHPQPSPCRQKVQQLMADYKDLLSSLLVRARTDGLLADTTEVPAAAVLFIGAVQGLVMQSLISGDLKHMATQAAPVFDIYEAGLRPASAPLPRKSK